MFKWKPLIGCFVLVGPDWTLKKKQVQSCFSFEKIQMSGATGVGQKPSSFERTLVSDLVNVWLDRLTIPLI